MPGINEEKRRHWLTVNNMFITAVCFLFFDQWNLIDNGHWCKCGRNTTWTETWKKFQAQSGITFIEISLVKMLTVWQLKVELESLQKLKFWPSVPLVMIKMSWLTDWLIRWLTDRETNRQTNRQTDRRTDRQTGWLTDRLTDWLTDRLTNWQTDWLTDWLTDCLTDRQTDWLSKGDWYADFRTEYLTVWRTDSLYLTVYFTGL